jgi:hypothetical protein
MSKKIHSSDIDQEKQVFEVTFPKFNLENIYICVGNDYEHNKTHVRYTIYNVDKETKKVSENIGYYEFAKDKERSELMDSDGDFKVMELGEDNITIHDEFIAKMSKSQRAKVTKPVEKPKKTEGENVQKPSPPKSFSPLDAANADEDSVLDEYFNGDKELKSAEIVPTFMKNFIKPKKWVNSVGVFVTSVYSDIYIIVISEGVPYTLGIPPVEVKPEAGDGNFINFQMKMYPILEDIEHDPAKKYALLLYEPRTHYKLLEHEGKVLFSENELPQKIIERVCKPHHPTEVVGVANSIQYKVIKTADDGDCFFDSVYRATKNVDDIHAAKNKYIDEVHEFRKEIAEGVKGNKIVERGIKQLYNLFSQSDLNNIRDKFYLGKNGKKPKSKDNEDNIFHVTMNNIFGMYPEIDLTYSEKEEIITNYLTLLYRFSPDVSSTDSKEFTTFAEKYKQLYSKGGRDVYEPLDIQYAELEKVLKPVEQPAKPKAKAKFLVLQDEPVVPEPVPAPVPPPAPAPVPAPVPPPAPVPEPTIKQVNIPLETDPVVASIIEIYNSSESIDEKKIKLNKFKKPQLAAAWDIIKEQVPGMKNPSPVNAPDYVNCLSNDPAHTCNKKESKKKGGQSNNNTRRKKI